jgi:four helix bundle protein
VIDSYRDLDVWQEAMTLVEEIYALSRRFPTDEYFGLTAQLRRAAVSVPSSVAEGSTCGGNRGYSRLVSKAMAATAEVETQLLVAERLHLAEAGATDAVLRQCGRVSGLLSRLHESLRGETSPVPEPQSSIPGLESCSSTTCNLA